MAKRRKITIKEHALIPKHVKLSEKEKKEVFERYKIGISELPKISHDDPAIVSLNAKAGDVIKIVRKSDTAGESIFYRGVISE